MTVFQKALDGFVSVLEVALESQGNLKINAITYTVGDDFVSVVASDGYQYEVVIS